MIFHSRNSRQFLGLIIIKKQRITCNCDKRASKVFFRSIFFMFLHSIIPRTPHTCTNSLLHLNIVTNDSFFTLTHGVFIHEHNVNLVWSNRQRSIHVVKKTTSFLASISFAFKTRLANGEINSYRLCVYCRCEEWPKCFKIFLVRIDVDSVEPFQQQTWKVYTVRQNTFKQLYKLDENVQ